jgi:DNA-binding SARP family transcriptional activator
MHFRILGPIEVCVNGASYSMGKNRQLTVLAALLLNANRAIPVERLSDAIWGDNAPKTAAAQIQTCIWRLRQAFNLAGLPASLIKTIGPGYGIGIEKTQIDLGVFGQQVDCARKVLAEGDRDSAIRTFRDALSLFRGPVLAEIPSLQIQTAATVLEERRLEVLEECIDLELAAGRHREVIGELIALVDQYPLRERFRAQYMMALHGSHRRAEALAAFHKVRDALITQLGIEPSRMLKELHAKLLADDYN